jgi:hypothetical protein
MRYRLVFNGELTGAVQKEDCLAQLAQLFGKDFESIRSKLFRGRPIVVKKTSDEQVAKRFVTAFETAGAVLHIQDADSETADSTPAPEPEIKAVRTQEELDTEVTRLRPTMKRSDVSASKRTPTLSEDDMTRQRQAVPEKDDRSSN